MRTFLISVTMFLAFSGFATNIAAQKNKPAAVRKVDSRLQPPPNRAFKHRFVIDVNYDKFEDSTKVQMRLPVNAVESVHFAYFFKGEKLRAAPTEIIFMLFKDKDRQFLLPVNDFVALTDRDRMRIKMVETPGLIIDGKNPYTAKLDYATFLKMVNAKTLDIKIGDFEIAFDNESMEALKDFGSRTNPAYRETKAQQQTNNIDKNITTEADNLRRLNLETKNEIREVLVAAKASMIICLGASEDRVKQASVASASQVYLKNKAAFTGDFAILVDEVMKALVRSDILRGIANGSIPRSQFGTQEIINEYQLAQIPISQRPAAILEVGDKYLDMVLRISREAGIIE